MKKQFYKIDILDDYLFVSNHMTEAERENLIKDLTDKELISICLHKFKEIVQKGGKNKKIHSFHTAGMSTCPLCWKYALPMKIKYDCENCPIYKNTGRQYCETTPYSEYEKAYGRDAKLNALKRFIEYLEKLPEKTP